MLSRDEFIRICKSKNIKDSELASFRNSYKEFCGGTRTSKDKKVLLKNQKAKFICKTVNLKVANTDSDFTKKYKKDQIIKIPIAHMDGNYFANNDVIKKLEDNQNIAFYYVDESGKTSEEANINGSALNIAGIFNDKKNVLGMMPHPERAIDENTGSSDGFPMFEGLFR